MTQTSLDKYDDYPDEETKTLQVEVLTLLKSNQDLTNYELADKMDCSVNMITTAINQLSIDGMIISKGTRDCYCSKCNIKRQSFKPIIHVKSKMWTIKD